MDSAAAGQTLHIESMQVSSGGQVLMAIEQHRAVCPGVTYAIDLDPDPLCKEHSINNFSAAADYWLTALFTAECVAKVQLLGAWTNLSPASVVLANPPTILAKSANDFGKSARLLHVYLN